MDIAWRVLEGFQSDRVMLVAAGVTFLCPVGPVSRDRRGCITVRALYRRNHHHKPAGSAL